MFQASTNELLASNSVLVKSGSEWLASSLHPKLLHTVQPALTQPQQTLTQLSARNLTRSQDPQELEINAIYTSWSRWSRCSRKCKQRRQRNCAVPAICGSAVIKMERGCHSDRCRGRDFHIVRKKKLRRKTKNQLKRNRAFYTKWSRWTPCTNFCKTTRLKACRFPMVCGNNEVTEEAYCYKEKSQCESWYKSGKSLDITDEEGFSLVNEQNKFNSVLNKFENINIKDYSGQCGVRNPTNAPKTGDIAWALKIIGGREADRGRWPWQIVILNKYREAFCGGTLIHPRWILTASHCVRKHLIVRVGEHDLVVHEGSEKEYVVKRAIIHPAYNRDTVDNDVALLELPEPVTLDRHAALACLPEQDEALPDQEHCTIIGWGKEKKSHFFGTEVLHEARVRKYFLIQKVNKKRPNKCNKKIYLSTIFAILKSKKSAIFCIKSAKCILYLFSVFRFRLCRCRTA